DQVGARRHPGPRSDAPQATTEGVRQRQGREGRDARRAPGPVVATESRRRSGLREDPRGPSTLNVRRPGSAAVPDAAEPLAPSARNRAAAVGFGVGLLAFVAYLPGLGRSLDFDSAETVGGFIRHGPPWAVFHEQAVFNNHPLFSFIEQLVRVLAGRTDV